MREAGRILANILNRLSQMVQPGITTQELDAEAERMILEAKATPTFRGQKGLVAKAPPYPCATCISINEEVIHGIPGPRVIRKGDIVSIDCGVTLNGLIADSATTVVAGDAPPEIKKLIDTTRHALERAIEKTRAGARLGDISFAVQSIVEAEGFGIVREFCGHGVGFSLHEDPSIPNYGLPGTGPLLREGMTFAIEPMVTLGRPAVKILSDGWTVVTEDGKPAVHFEHTVVVKKDGAEILTLP